MTNLKNSPKTGAIVTAAASSAARRTKPGGPAAKAVAISKAKMPGTGAPEVPPKPAPAKGAAQPKPKLVRDSFTIPKSEYALLDALKLRAAKLERPIKKGELLRAGIAALNAMDGKMFLAALSAVPSLKTGRPKRSVDSGSD
jgi:hypothetical protein